MKQHGEPRLTEARRLVLERLDKAACTIDEACGGRANIIPTLMRFGWVQPAGGGRYELTGKGREMLAGPIHDRRAEFKTALSSLIGSYSDLGEEETLAILEEYLFEWGRTMGNPIVQLEST